MTRLQQCAKDKSLSVNLALFNNIKYLRVQGDANLWYGS